MLLNPPSRSPRCAAFQHVASDAQRLANTGRICARLASKVLRRVAEQCVENRLCRNVQTASHSTTLAKRVDYLRQRNCLSPATSRPTINDPKRTSAYSWLCGSTEHRLRRLPLNLNSTRVHRNSQTEEPGDNTLSRSIRSRLYCSDSFTIGTSARSRGFISISQFVFSRAIFKCSQFRRGRQ